MCLRFFFRPYRSSIIKFYFTTVTHSNRVSVSVDKLKIKNVNFLSTAIETKNSCNNLTFSEYDRVSKCELFSNNSKYSHLIFNPDSESPELEKKCESLRIIKEFLTNPNGVDLKTLPQLLEKEMSSLTLDELLNVTHWSLKCIENNKNKEMLSKVFLVLNKKLLLESTWTRDEMFKILSVLFNKRNSIYFKNFRKQLFKLSEKVKTLTPEQFVLICVYCNVNNQKLGKSSKYNVEVKLAECVSVLNLKEIEIISKMLHRNESYYFKTEVNKKIWDKLCENIENPHIFEFPYIMKLFEKSKFSGDAKEEMQNKIVPHISSMSYCSLIKLCESNIFNYELMMILLQNALTKCKEEISKCSNLEIRSLFIKMAEYNLYDEDVVKEIIVRCENLIVGKKDIKTEDRFFVLKVLEQLMHYQIYPENLLRQIMTQEFCASLLKDSGNQLRLWNFINYSLAIENPKFHCALDSTVEKKAFKANFYVQNPKNFYKISYNVENELRKIYGETTCYWIRPIPSFLEVPVMRFDKNFQARDIPDEYKNISKLMIKKPTDNDHVWISFAIESITNKINENEVSGSLKTKLRQFKKIGFLPITIYSKIWVNQIQNNTQEQYLKNLILNELQSLNEER